MGKAHAEGSAPSLLAAVLACDDGMSARVLIIDDDDDYAAALSRHLNRAGHEVIKLHDATSARSQIWSTEVPL